jgi:hypothetical protein
MKPLDLCQSILKSVTENALLSRNHSHLLPDRFRQHGSPGAAIPSQLGSNSETINQTPGLHSAGLHHLAEWPKIQELYRRSGVVRDTSLVTSLQSGDVPSPSRIRLLHDSYMCNVWPLMPILSASSIQTETYEFIQRYSCGIASKRKFPPEMDPSTNYGQSDALVLLVLALGSIFENARLLFPKEHCSSACQQSHGTDQADRSFLDPLTAHGYPSGSTARPFPDYRPLWPHNAGPGEPSPCPATVPRIPGLGYFTEAMRIMSTIPEANSLECVQVFILAALYWGQLGNTAESATYIMRAADIMSILIAIHEHDLMIHTDNLTATTLEVDDTTNLVSLAFWSVLELESVIREQLDNFPPCTLPSLAEKNGKMVRYPSLVGVPRPDRLPLFYCTLRISTIPYFFSAQIYLRSILNQARSSLHQPNENRDTTRIANSLWMSLQAWRRGLCGGLEWTDSRPPTWNFLGAIIRAKYYDAVYLVHRNALRRVLHEPQHFSAYNYEVLNPWGLLEPNSNTEEVVDDVLACMRCISAALQGAAVTGWMSFGVKGREVGLPQSTDICSTLAG